MTARRLDGQPVAAELLRDVRERMTRLGTHPALALLLPPDSSARSYARAITRALSPLGIGVHTYPIDEATGETGFRTLVTHLNQQPETTGILALQPLPPNLSRWLPALTIDPDKDVDGVTPVNAGRLQLGLPSVPPSTPAGGLELLRYYDIPLEGRHAVVVGRSPVVGRPLASLLLAADATVTVCHSKTVDLGSVTRTADVLFVAAGAPGLVRPDMVRPGTVVVDFGVTVVDGRLVGDVDPAVAEVASALTPVPGGTGPVTTAVLARNLVSLAERQFGITPGVES